MMIIHHARVIAVDVTHTYVKIMMSSGEYVHPLPQRIVFTSFRLPSHSTSLDIPPPHAWLRRHEPQYSTLQEEDRHVTLQK